MGGIAQTEVGLDVAAESVGEAGQLGRISQRADGINFFFQG